MIIHALPAFHDNYIWMIHEKDQKYLICIDPGDAAPVISYIEQQQLGLSHILITHHHADHIGGVADLLAYYPTVSIYGPNDQRLVALFPMMMIASSLQIQDIYFEILVTPGHTRSHICYYAPKHRWLFCGDTLFSAGCGRVFDGTLEELYHSLQCIKQLPNDTLIYCAHEYSAQNIRFAAMIEPNNAAIKTHAMKLENRFNQCSLPTLLQLEKQINPFLRTKSPGLKAFAKQHEINPEDDFAIFKQLRAEKDVFI